MMTKEPDPNIIELGDAALLVKYGEEISLALNRRVHALDARLRQSPLRGVVEMAPAYASLVVHYDPLVLTYAQAVEWVRGEMLKVQDEALRMPRRVEVPVRYGGEHGPDLEFVAT